MSAPTADVISLTGFFTTLQKNPACAVTHATLADWLTEKADHTLWETTLENYPFAHTVREYYAQWLSEIGDPRNIEQMCMITGMRIIERFKLKPSFYTVDGNRERDGSVPHIWVSSTDRLVAPAEIDDPFSLRDSIPDPWFDCLPKISTDRCKTRTKGSTYRCFPSVTVCFEEVALAYSRLSGYWRDKFLNESLRFKL